MGREIHSGDRHIIMCGGNPLPNSPKSWDEAHAWADKANEGKEEGPQWKFDCGFKLDYDGDLISVSCRFYPPADHYGPKWDGYVSIYFMGVEYVSEEIVADTIDELKAKVEEYVDGFKSKLEGFLEKCNEL